MAHAIFSLDGPAFEVSTRHVIRPDHIMPVQEEEEGMPAGFDNRPFQPPPGPPAPLPPPSEQGDQAADAPESSLLKCTMEGASDHLHAFQEYEHYYFSVNSGSDCEVPEDELTDEMEDISSDDDELVPENLQEEEGPTEGDHGQQSPGNINSIIRWITLQLKNTLSRVWRTFTYRW